MVIGVKETATPTTRATLVSCFRVRKDRISRSRSSSYERETSQSFLSGACGLRDHHQSNSYYGEAYADPRCEMKKRQQQEIVVSGLTINTSDISSGEELAGAAITNAAIAEDNSFATMTEMSTSKWISIKSPKQSN